MEEDRKKQIVIEILSTILVLVVYWISTQPEWKLEMYLRWLTERLPRPVRESPDKLSQEQKAILANFRREISNFRWNDAS